MDSDDNGAFYRSQLYGAFIAMCPEMMYYF